MQRVTGLGGIFFKSRDPEALRAWYERHLGIASPYGSAMFDWRHDDDPLRRGMTVWSPFAEDTKYFAPSEASFMVNYRVDDLEGVLAQLREEGVEVDKVEESEYGRFAWVMDPERNRVELWQAPAEGVAPSIARAEKPAADEYGAYFGRYVQQVPDGDVVTTLREQIGAMRELVAGVDEEKGHYRYAEGKWSVAEVLGHLIDAERVFSYRLFCISRGETQSLPGFDEGPYLAAANYDARPVRSLFDEFELVRRAQLMVIENLSDEAWTRRGVANETPVTARALAWITAGHLVHHRKVLKERYGV